MKRIAATLLSTLVLLSVFMLNVSAEDLPDAYRPVIERYIACYQDPNPYAYYEGLGTYGGGSFDREQCLTDCGYSLYDMNSDGTPELFIGTNYFGGGTNIAAVYSIENGQAKQLMFAEGQFLSLLGDLSSIGHPDWKDCIRYFGNWDNEGPVFNIYKFDGTNLTKIAETRNDVDYEKDVTLPITVFNQYQRKPIEIPEGPAGTIYRLYNGGTGEHLYSPDHNEATVLANNGGWTYEGYSWTAPTSGDAVYRLYNPGINDHLYTTDENEVNVLTTQQGWQADNGGQPLFYSGGDKPIFRLYNPESGRHHLTTDENEYNTLQGSGWQQEGRKLSCIS